MKRILITGGAGFAGSNIAVQCTQRYAGVEVIALDNLKRRGAELTLPRLREHGIRFVHGDVRVKQDILEVGPVDLIVDCSAEPSVLAGSDGSPQYVIDTNLYGTINCLEAARLSGATLLFLSTSRVYPVEALNSLSFQEEETRFALKDSQPVLGASAHGISEQFPLAGVRSIYGTSKLASELLLQEYIDAYGIKGVINRCGVLTGPWQMGKVDQGVIVLWIAKHIFKKELSYIGFGGQGKQVRDILHIQDLCDLLFTQLDRMAELNGSVFNVGGGQQVSVSLRELSAHCVRCTGNTIPIRSQPENRPNDIISYISDCRKVEQATGWKPAIGVESIVEQIARWICDHKIALEPILA
jgi:CDP-paratose 2-epimerase